MRAFDYNFAPIGIDGAQSREQVHVGGGGTDPEVGGDESGEFGVLRKRLGDEIYAACAAAAGAALVKDFDFASR